MPVTTKSKKYDEFSKTWKLCRDVVIGERAVKKAGEIYLPKLSEQDEDDYTKYKERAVFFPVTRRTLQGLLGAIFRKEPEIEPPSPYLRNELDDITREVIEVGRVGILVDVPKSGGNSYIVQYKAEDVINWGYKTVDGQVVLDWVSLREVVLEPDPEDPFESNEVERYRVLSLKNGVYTQNLWENQATKDGDDNWVEGEDIVPQMRGASMNEIPFKFINAINDKPDIDEPPLSDIARINVSHYRTSADLEHGRHYTALPTPWVAGFDPATKLVLGAGEAWVTDNVAAHAGFLEFTGSGLSTLVLALEEKQAMMAASGSQMIQGQRAAVEAAETARIHKAGEEATISTIAKNVSSAMTQVYQWMLDFTLTKAGKKALVALSTDYLSIPIDPAEIMALLKSYQAGVISMDTLLWNLKQGEVIPPERTLEQERELAEQGQAALMDMMTKASGAMTKPGAPNPGDKGGTKP